MRDASKPTSPYDRTYTYTHKGNCVPFGHGVHQNEEEAEAAAKLMVDNMPFPENKEIIIKVIR